MTNADKFLKDGVDIDEFASELYSFWWSNEYDVYDGIRGFLHAKAKKQPTLTEDERVILRNIPKEYPTIARNTVGELSARNNDDWSYMDAFNHLFQFIKNGEEYRIEELLNED